MTSRQWAALLGASRTHPRLVREMLDKVAADYEKPCAPLVDLVTRKCDDGESFIVEVVYPPRPRRAR